MLLTKSSRIIKMFGKQCQDNYGELTMVMQQMQTMKIIPENMCISPLLPSTYYQSSYQIDQHCASKEMYIHKELDDCKTNAKHPRTNQTNEMNGLADLLQWK